ncbi:MAG: hypothetical protein INR70_08795 [Parafilimonas terrae]|nr:hypothetical protein [Parafilimonas terrae]
MALLAISDPQAASASKNGSYERNYERTYLAYFDIADDEHYVLTHCGIDVFNAHPSAPASLVNNVAVKPNAGNGITVHNGVKCRCWAVTVGWGPWNPTAKGSNPLTQPTRYRTEFIVRNEPAFVDIDGAPILNTAGDPYDPGIEAEPLVMVLTVSRNEASPNPVTLAALSNSTNLASWNGFDPRTVKLAPVKIPEPDYDQESNTNYRKMEYVFEIDPRGHRKKVVNRGVRVLDANGKPTAALDAQFKPVKEPVLLDINGKQITNPTAQNIVIREHKILKETDFSALNMDNLFS